MATLITLILSFISVLGFHLYDRHYRYHITAKFVDSGPLHKNMPIYCKGYKIGKIEDVKLSKDCKYTFVKIVLFSKEQMIPENVIAQVKTRESKEDYIDLVIPEDPSTTILKNGGVIEGEAAFELGKFLSGILASGMLDPIIEDASALLSSISDTSDKIGSFFSDSHVLLDDNRQNIRHSTKSLTEITSKINNSIKEEELNNTMSRVGTSSTNILAASESIKNITAKVDCATNNIDKTVEKVDSTMSDVKASASNIKSITSGLCEVLTKRFAGLRIIFGRPMKKNSCPNNCTK